ncbi:unnamed protein product [Aureobasidium vineae]|uniref:Uncharacterized protein n=1 Tax=Aureobasidium vineae TaxID=2773715 RepID=A0A9N8JS05_9PEZI|nr:unnamed protein product [Aureobasidium vineae]
MVGSNTANESTVATANPILVSLGSTSDALPATSTSSGAITASVISYTSSGVPLASTIFPTGLNSTITSSSSPLVLVSGSASPSGSSSAHSSSLPSFAKNLTTSATVISSSSTTYTSFTTFQRNSVTSSISNTASIVSSADRSASTSSTPLAAVLGFFTASSSTIETLSDGSPSTAVLVAQAFATTLSNGQTTTSYGSFQPVSSSASGYAALSGSSEISSAAVALSSQNADISSRLSSLNAAASTATGSARSSYSSQAVVLQSAASSALRSASSALSSAASRVSSEASSASVLASSSADSSLPSSSATQSPDASVVGGPTTTTAPNPASSSASSENNSDNTPPPSVLAGGIVGGVAGLAVLVLTAMIFLRWYRKRMASMSMNALTGAEAVTGSGGARGMSERGRTAPVLAPLLGGVFKNRKSRAVDDTGERGFQRISGRKLPSAFSAGMTSAPPMLMPSAFDNDRNMSTTSVYRDSTYYGAAGSPFDDPDNEIGINETIMPGPARQARVHPPYAMSPTSALSENTSPTSPTFPIQGHRLTPEPGQNAPLMTPLNPQGMARRSVTPATLSSFDGSRGSRFTEEV